MNRPKIANFLDFVRTSKTSPPDSTPALARFSNLAGTSYKRHIQSLHEHGDRRNPDILASALMTEEERNQCLVLKNDLLTEMRKDAYYHYLTARTKAYDQLLLDAVVQGFRRVLIVGSGFDTRFYRFGGLLAKRGVEVAECDQPAAIAVKKSLAAALPYADRVEYFDIDLNIPQSWSSVWRWLGATPNPVLILAEGVSPYIESSAFLLFLDTLAKHLPSSSRLAYDFKRIGVADGFGVSATVTSPYRLSLDEPAIAELHARLGFCSASVTTSFGLMRAHIPSWSEQVSPLFDEDAMIQAVR